IILLLEPDAAIQASFQMSFMAVLGLTAFYEFWSEWRKSRDEEVRQRRHWAVRLAQRLGVWLAAAIATTIVAGAMSSIPAAYHFGRIAPYSIVANGLALPVISLIMPLALAGFVVMPLGLEATPLWLMGKGIELMIAISDWVAGLPGAATILAQLSPVSTMIMASGAAMLCLLRGPARLAGPAVVAAGLLLGNAQPMPDILIDRTASTVAVLDATGLLVAIPGRKGRFSVTKWLQANGEEALPAEAAKRSGWNCDESRCTATVRGRQLAYVQNEQATLDCAGIDILVASYPLRGACKSVPLRIDRFDVWKNGTHALWLDGPTVVATARGESGERPWV
ncbi:MAG: ComEC/Rec2 family competence protein, partial [Methylocella sp.]